MCPGRVIFAEAGPVCSGSSLTKFLSITQQEQSCSTVVLSWVPVEVTLVLQVMAPMSRQQYLGWPDA